MEQFKTDIAVALIFFNRPDSLEKVFASVRNARPSRLYLIQDGPREGKPNDVINIEACRNIVSNIDWQCTVIEDYSDINLGCGKRIFSGLSNVFKHEEYAAVIEDDIVIGDSFLPFCKEMCELYRNDQRIHMISGMNHLGVYEDCPYDYFFSQFGGAIWGWATWARAWNELDWSMSALKEPYIFRSLKSVSMHNNKGRSIAASAAKVRNDICNGKNPTYWSLHFGLYGALGSRLNIVPKYNLISNIGLAGDSVHAPKSIRKLPKRIRVVFFAKIYSMPKILNHPICVVNDQYYLAQQDKIMNPSKLTRLFELPRRIIYKLF